MCPAWMPDIMSLAQAVIQKFCSQSCFTVLKNAKSEKGDISAKYLQKIAKS